MKWLVAISGLLSAAIIGDYKISSIQREIRQSRSVAIMSKQEGLFVRYNSHYNRKKVSAFLAHTSGDFELSEYPQHPAVDFAVIRRNDPLAHIFLAVVDLKHPYVQLKLDDVIAKKYLTSEFAKKNHCLMAINGEAGLDPGENSGFGEWVGNYFCNGKAVMKKDNNKSPFIAFSRSKHAVFYPAEVVDTLLDSNKFNAIYGRFDIIRDGVNLGIEAAWKQPRTIMGIDKDGWRLYLMVIDGRQEGYSLGMGLKEAADILIAFGCRHAMSCDQGGSSTFYLKSYNGLVNRPSDDGNERPTYTHFGISIIPEKH